MPALSIDPESFNWPQSIRGINNLDRDTKEELYFSLIPQEAVDMFRIDPHDRARLRIHAPADTRSVEMYFFARPEDGDPVFYLHMADTLNYQIAVLLLVVNDPNSPRFNTDVDASGRPTRFGTMRRNIEEEARALKAGLGPGQIRAGLRLFRHALPTFERFVAHTGHDMVIMDPLSYQNAIVYERYGFNYLHGRRRMEWINEALRPGGELFDRYDLSTPFRDPEQWRSIRGRAWAIHDDILGEPLGDIRMYKRLGHHAGVNTFPDAAW